jgi:hypothetical protein
MSVGHCCIHTLRAEGGKAGKKSLGYCLQQEGVEPPRLLQLLQQHRVTSRGLVRRGGRAQGAQRRPVKTATCKRRQLDGG